MAARPNRESIDKLTWTLVTLHEGDSCQVVQGDPEQVLGVSAEDFATHGLSGLVLGNAPAPCAWEQACDESVYLLRKRGGQAQWVQSRSSGVGEDQVLVATRVMELAPSRGKLATLGRLALGGSLMGPLAHEVNNFVQGLSSAGYFLGDCLTQGESIDAEFVKDFGAVVDELAKLGRSLQNFARLKDPGSEASNLRGAIDSSAEVLRCAGLFKVVSLCIEPFEGSAELDWEQAHLEYVFLALLSNAATAASQNKELQEVRLSVRAQADLITIEIRDSGKGMRLAQDPLPYVMGEHSPRHLGLGLSIATILVASHGGSLESETKQEGSIVRLRLPTSAR